MYKLTKKTRWMCHLLCLRFRRGLSCRRLAHDHPRVEDGPGLAEHMLNECEAIAESNTRRVMASGRGVQNTNQNLRIQTVQAACPPPPTAAGTANLATS